jgi:serine beta-lactamase-like protein LACTB, mitochondrial
MISLHNCKKKRISIISKKMNIKVYYTTLFIMFCVLESIAQKDTIQDSKYYHSKGKVQNEILLLSEAQGIAIDSAKYLIKKAMEKDHLPSLSVSVSKNGKIILQIAYGIADIENHVLASPKSVYRIGSISKTLTASVVMSLYEKGLLNLNDTIQKHCTAFPIKQASISIKQLLNHQAGIRHYSNKYFKEEFYSTTRYLSSSDAISLFKNDSLIAMPGTKYSYSSFGYELLGCAIEGINKRTYEETLNQYILTPSQMIQTTVDYPEKIIHHRVKQYEKNKDGSPRNSNQIDLSNRFAGGGVLSTATDLVLFGNALLEGKILQKSTLETMWTKQNSNDGKSTPYCLGWTQFDDKNEIFHGGSSVGGQAYLYIVLNEKIVISFMTNTEVWGQPRHKLAQEIARVFLKY